MNIKIFVFTVFLSLFFTTPLLADKYRDFSKLSESEISISQFLIEHGGKLMFANDLNMRTYAIKVVKGDNNYNRKEKQIDVFLNGNCSHYLNNVGSFIQLKPDISITKNYYLCAKAVMALTSTIVNFIPEEKYADAIEAIEPYKNMFESGFHFMSRIASDLHYSAAMTDMVNIYDYGKDYGYLFPDRDDEKALYWLKTAARYGDHEAAKILDSRFDYVANISVETYNRRRHEVSFKGCKTSTFSREISINREISISSETLGSLGIDISAELPFDLASVNAHILGQLSDREGKALGVKETFMGSITVDCDGDDKITCFVSDQMAKGEIVFSGFRKNVIQEFEMPVSSEYVCSK